MRCSGSPTISSAVEPGSREAAQRALATVLFREILRPLAAGLGPLGDVATEPLARRLAGLPPQR